MAKSEDIARIIEPVPVFTIHSLVTSTDTDMDRRQKPSSMFGVFQDIAAAHARNLGADVRWLYDEFNLAWILMRIRLEIDTYPLLGQEMTVETWPQTPRALYERDYVMRDTEGNALVRAASTWIIMDLGTREIKRDMFLDYKGIELKKERALGKGVDRLKPQKSAQIIFTKEIHYSDIDYNLHVNNSKYVDIIMDAFPFDIYVKNEIKAIEVHYVNEIGPGEHMRVRRQRIEKGKYYIDGIRKSDKETVFCAIVEWREKNGKQNSI